MSNYPNDSNKTQVESSFKIISLHHYERYYDYFRMPRGQLNFKDVLSQPKHSIILHNLMQEKLSNIVDEEFIADVRDLSTSSFKKYTYLSSKIDIEEEK